MARLQGGRGETCQPRGANQEPGPLKGRTAGVTGGEGWGKDGSQQSGEKSQWEVHEKQW